MRRTGYGLKQLAALLAVSMTLTGLAPATQAEAANTYKKFPTYTKYENKYGKAGMTADPSTLETLLGSKSYQYVYLKNKSTAMTYTIPANSKFSDKRLRVNAPLSTIINHATMKIIKISSLDGEWREYGTGNSFSVVDPDTKIVVGKAASVDRLYFKADNGKVNLEVKGDVKKTGFYGNEMDAKVTISDGTTQEMRIASEDSKVEVTAENQSEIGTVTVLKNADVTLNVNDGVEKVVLESAANVTITGDSEKVKEVTLEVSEKAEGAKVTSDVPVKAEVAAKAELTLNKGAEGSTVKKADEKVEVEVKNDTTEKVTVSTEGSDKTEVVEGNGTTGSTGNTGNTGNTGSGTTVLPGPSTGTPSTPSTPDTGDDNKPENPDKPETPAGPAEGSTIDNFAVAVSNNTNTITVSNPEKGKYTATIDLTKEETIPEKIPVKVTLTGTISGTAITSGAVTVTKDGAAVTSASEEVCEYSFDVAGSDVSAAENGTVTVTLTVAETANPEVTHTITITIQGKTAGGEEPDPDVPVTATSISAIKVTALNIEGTATKNGNTFTVSELDLSKETLVGDVTVTVQLTGVTLGAIDTVKVGESGTAQAPTPVDKSEDTFSFTIANTELEKENPYTLKVILTEKSGVTATLNITFKTKEIGQAEVTKTEYEVASSNSVVSAVYTVSAAGAEVSSMTVKSVTDGFAKEDFTVEGATLKTSKLAETEKTVTVTITVSGTDYVLDLTVATVDEVVKALEKGTEEGAVDLTLTEAGVIKMNSTSTTPSEGHSDYAIYKTAAAATAAKDSAYAFFKNSAGTAVTVGAIAEKNLVNVSSVSATEESKAGENEPHAIGIYQYTENGLKCMWSTAQGINDTTNKVDVLTWHDVLLTLSTANVTAGGTWYCVEANANGSTTVIYSISLAE